MTNRRRGADAWGSGVYVHPVRRAIGAWLAAAALLGAAGVGAAWVAPSPQARAQAAGTAHLVLAGARATSGVHSVRAGAMPDPFSVPVRPAGTLRAQDMRLGPGCRGFVAAQPDVIVRFSGAAAFLRFFARSSDDVTLLVHDPSGRLRCNDDMVPGRNTNPMVDVYQPRPGQYDVWVGTRDAEARPSVTLFVTQNRDQQP